MDKYIAFDAETGGVETNCTLLTLYMRLLDDDLNFLDEIHLKLKPNNGDTYIVTAGALEVNMIDLVQHDAVAITLSEGGKQLREFLKKSSDDGKTKLIPIGHNVGFDEDFIWAWLLNKREYQKYVSYRRIDTGVEAQVLKKKGKLPKAVSGSLSSLMDHYGIRFEGQAHEEKADTLGTIEVLKEMLKQ